MFGNGITLAAAAATGAGFELTTDLLADLYLSAFGVVSGFACVLLNDYFEIE